MKPSKGAEPTKSYLMFEKQPILRQAQKKNGARKRNKLVFALVCECVPNK